MSEKRYRKVGPFRTDVVGYTLMGASLVSMGVVLKDYIESNQPVNANSSQFEKGEAYANYQNSKEIALRDVAINALVEFIGASTVAWGLQKTGAEAPQQVTVQEAAQVTE
jgi:hypothetical protein